jgi:hypothetical protein
LVFGLFDRHHHFMKPSGQMGMPLQGVDPSAREDGRRSPIDANCVEPSGERGENFARWRLESSMPAHDPAHADDPARHRNLYDATIEHAMQAGATDARLDALGAKIDDLAASIDKRIEQVDKRIEQIDKRFEQVDKRFEQVDKRIEQVDKRFEQVERRLEALEIRFFYLQLALIGGLVGVIATLLASPQL